MFERPDILEGDSRLAELVRRLVDAFQRERLYLFGSRARAQADADSDYDLLMILPKLEGPAYRVAQQAHSLVWSRDEFERRVEVKTSLPAVVLREGTLLHEA